MTTNAKWLTLKYSASSSQGNVKILLSLLFFNFIGIIQKLEIYDCQYYLWIVIQLQMALSRRLEKCSWNKQYTLIAINQQNASCVLWTW